MRIDVSVSHTFRYAVAALVVLAGSNANAQLSSRLDCLLQPFAQADISTREQGVIEEIFVERGDTVTPNQAVVRLESGVEKAAVDLIAARAKMQAELEEARINLEFATRRYDRVRELYEQKAISFDDRDQVATEAALAQLRLNQVQQDQEIVRLELARAERQLALRTIRSPFAGVVVERLLQAGESVEDRPIMRLAQLDPLNVEVIVPVENFGAIERGVRAVVTPRLPGATPATATVTVVDRVIDAASNTFGVRLELPNPDNVIPGGVRCDIEFLPQQ